MEKPEIAVGTQPYQFTDFIADILDSIVVSDEHLHRFFLTQQHHFDLYLIRNLLQLPPLLVIVKVMKKIPSQLNLSPTQDRKRLFFLPFGKVAPLEPTDAHTLPHGETFLVGMPGHLVEVLREVEIPQEVVGVFLDELVVEHLLEDLHDDKLAGLYGLRLVTVEPVLLETLLLRDFKRALIVLLHLLDHPQHRRKPQMQQLLQV